MPVILLLLGIVTTIAGAFLVVSGVTFRDGTLDTEAITPGVIAAIGGLLLIGMGLAVRELQRIERALAARPMPRASRTADTLAGIPAAETTEPSVRIPFPSKPRSNPQAVPLGDHSKPVAAEETSAEPMRAKFPTLPGCEAGPLVEENADEVRQPAAATVGRGGNGASAARMAPRLDAKPRAAVVSDTANVSGLKAFLSGKLRRDGRTDSAQVTAVAKSAERPAPESEPKSAPAIRPMDAVSVLKSGVVEGMAYTLYSDGSIEAQLPQGTLRFGSITALREHIDSSA